MIERFDFYGFRVDVSSPASDIAKEVRRDFAYFRVPEGNRNADVSIAVHLTAPSYDNLPNAGMSIVTPRNVCFRSGKTTYVDYFGKGLAVYNRNTMTCEVYAADRYLAHEIVYLFILSTVGKNLDSRGLHRIHALGVSYRRKAILLLLPSGGGKSTIALELLHHPDFLLLSEDTPLIDRRGRVLPFPLRIGIHPGKSDEVPPEHLRTVKRMEFDPKTLIDIEYFRDRLGETVPPGMILAGERNLGSLSEIVPLAPHRTFNALLKYMVVGLGVYQGLEFLLERGVWEMLASSGVVASRCYNGLQLLARAKGYRFVLGRDITKNCETLIRFIEEQCV